MKKKMKACTFLLQALTLMVAALWVSPAAVTAQEKVTNVWGEMVDKPRYGGTITIPSMWNIDPEICDPWHSWVGTMCVNPVLEKMGIGDWSIKEEEFSFRSRFIALTRTTGSLAESFEQPDAFTIIYHIRKGVHWHDKPPMNGRELDAHDVAYSFQRIFGLGDWKKDGPTKWGMMSSRVPITSVTATDKWTVVVKSPSYSPMTEHWLYFEGWEDSWVSPTEVLKQDGHHKGWEKTIGTGPFMITDHVEGSSWTYTKNPNYWRTSQRYPGMRLPFIDELKLLIMKDDSAKIAALRTGKIDELLHVPFEQAEALEKSNPYLVKAVQEGVGKGGDGWIPTMNVTRPPFNDIRVRQAMQKALNLEEITKGYYKGQAVSVPLGIGGVSVASERFNLPFEEWPEDVKEGYRYDPEGAKRLLAEAGYPSGFEFTFDTAANQDLDIVQLYKAYWSQIGVTANINVMDGQATLKAAALDKKFEMINYGSRGIEYHPFGRVNYYESDNTNNHAGWSDPHYDKLAHNFYNAPNQEALRKASVEASQYFVKAQINLALPSNHAFHFAQPWIKGGWWGQDGMGGGMLYVHFGRFWIDQDLKKQILGQ